MLFVPKKKRIESEKKIIEECLEMQRKLNEETMKELHNHKD